MQQVIMSCHDHARGHLPARKYACVVALCTRPSHRDRCSLHQELALIDNVPSNPVVTTVQYSKRAS
jgi:hypothetical protein